MSVITEILSRVQCLRADLNQQLIAIEPVFLVGGTAALAFGIHFISIRIPKDGVPAGTRRAFFRAIKKIPFIKSKIDQEVSKAVQSISENVEKLYRGADDKCTFITKLPKHPMTSEELLRKVEEYLLLGYKGSEEGLISGALYHGGKELTELNAKVYEMSSWSNTLHADIYPGILKMEAEIVRIVADLFHGDDDTCGTVTSCGTESIILAVKAYRDWGVMERGILPQNTEIVVPITAHSSFEKAAHLLNMGIKFVPIDKTTCRVDVQAMKKMISKNTVMICGSAPAFPHGCMDDIKSISELGLKYKIPVHVDACLGGFLVAFMPKAGFPLKPFDFELPGVTSISADTHKYGYTPKGSSVLLYREKKYRHYQYFMHTEWPGGLYASPTLAGSRPGALIAVCWTSILYFGMDGYVEITRKIVETSRLIKYKLKQMDGINVMGNPEMSVIALESEHFDIYRLLDLMKSKGWVMNALQFPPSIHFCLSYNQTAPEVSEKFIRDIQESVSTLMSDPDGPSTGVAAIYGSTQTVPDRSLIGDITAIYMDTLYKTNF